MNRKTMLHRTVALAMLSASAAGRCAVAVSTPAQALSYVRASDLRLSPDGSQLAYVAVSYNWDAKPHLRVLDIAAGTERELTPAGKSDRSPQWSPDGTTLAYLSNVGGKTQVYTTPSRGGTATALTARKFGVDRFHWSPDGRTIAYLARDDDAQPHGIGPQVADREDDLSRVWLVDLGSAASRKLGVDRWRIDELQWRDPTHLLLVATERPNVEENTDAVYALSTATGAVERVAAPPQPFDALLVSPDARTYLVRSTVAGGPSERDLLVGSVRGGELKALTPVPDLAIAEVKWRDPSAVWARVVDGFWNRIVRLAPGAAAAAIDLPLSVASFDVARDGELVFVGEDFDHLPEIYLRTNVGRVRQLTHLQQGWDGVQLAMTTVFQTRSFDGTMIEAALMKPAVGAVSRAPLVLLVHGGPSSNFTAGFSWEAAWAQMLVAHGYQVLMVNPRGSNGYSEAFLKANRGDWGGGDYRDLIAVLDAVIAKGEVDPERLGIGGWSYGGEMTAWAITQTHRFKAAVAGAGVFDQQAEFETEAHPDGDEWYFGTPWEHPDVFARNSPATYIRNARTPTLILDGEDDASNPVGQSKGLYRALKHFGVETEMVLYPNEGHSPRLGSNNIDMFERILAWYDSHLQAK
ncbi:S9 family peptidase (plasmid) [Polymorphobacter sp. PAMC 29334]|uniref:S9 family peptidase n=1 Tax=Polymorphobacter sp. PAMC 29334 TaxID=2862331 RepID=UPI001C671B06|nr:S9 family peptidase [Polymorphobacter sp. PAMC 29334]QYE33432.1 S9 family peptidase [Polymorphobacter sp. PAMC 29334]